VAMGFPIGPHAGPMPPHTSTSDLASEPAAGPRSPDPGAFRRRSLQIMVLPALVEPESELGRDEIARYSRHLIIPEFAMTGQRRLRDARVLLIGAGGLGSPNAMYLAAAGVGEIGLVDFDVVDASNLQRQGLRGTRDIRQ